jgi:hypothetical protein
MQLSHRITVPFLSLAVLAGAACGEDPAGLPRSDSGTWRPSYNFTNGPPSPGPFIVRIADAGTRVISADLANNLLAIHGKVSGLSECTDASTRVPADIQVVNTPSNAQDFALVLKGVDNDVSIYEGIDFSQLFPFDPVKFCAFITQRVPLFTGQVQYQLHINGEGNLRFEWQGFVQRVADGARFHYVEIQFADLTPNGGGSSHDIGTIRLQAGADS